MLISMVLGTHVRIKDFKIKKKNSMVDTVMNKNRFPLQGNSFGGSLQLIY